MVGFGSSLLWPEITEFQALVVEAGQKAPAMQTVAQKLSLFPSNCEEVGVLNVFNNNSFPPGPTLNLGTTYHDVVFYAHLSSLLFS